MTASICPKKSDAQPAPRDVEELHDALLTQQFACPFEGALGRGYYEATNARANHYLAQMLTGLLEKRIQAAEAAIDNPGPYDDLSREERMADLEWLRSFPRLSTEEREALLIYLAKHEGEDVGSHFQIIQDRAEVFPGGDREAYMRRYAKELPNGWHEGVIVCLVPGEYVKIVRWTAAPVSIDVTRIWAEQQPALDSGEHWQSRWKVLDSLGCEESNCLALPPTAPVRTLTELVSKPSAVANVVMPTGIAALDRVLAVGGLPLRGARCVVQAPTANGKTAFVLEIAASLAAAGVSVFWIATRDEPPGSVHARWLQREGMSREEAMATATGDGTLAPNLLMLDGREVDLEDVLAGIVDIPNAVLVLDTLQKTRTRAGADSGQIESIGKVLELVETSGLTCIMTSAQVRGGARSKRPALEASFGGQQIEGGATLLLGLALAKAELVVSVLKSRIGGEGETLTLTLDRERQRITSPGDATGATTPAEVRIWVDVQAAVREAPRSRRWLEDNITGMAAAIRAVVKARLASGDLAPEGRLVALPR